ncbi:G protein-coupled receptor, rhodopsin-like family and GPCR, rhodopsin-like, 7TM domain-containing protein [Strongyloides ratti]|uniref:G protein-coupled receptor, rhodopsin-like family and GPCR, rhodopsin-like, 7TM domain-containing protein n=1 Tax=Strongyloides ratti TaxID=34506 RepID=A0A090N108_STRRB|nr:G protein-coupled receptor, rhodopsin-like family and GPCR, rhodopsin-like, 7TM domain-containing protein [Strongyloides ratti]CEF71613.1 G protein-coupled receptor, rhodopsin-like family and GPCR, rhodopsin-like, 7TM domain-containing protein [Strongyloides ratti]
MNNISEINILNGLNSILLNNESPSFVDVILFLCLELLGIFAIIGNILLILVLFRNKYLTKPSFILMFSLAVADVIHGLVTTLHFYPPILLKKTIFPWIAVRIWNILDWTAWGITLTHMAAMCLDRLTAIMLYARYNQIITLQRISRFTIFCWGIFLTINIMFFIFNFCCMITPIKAHSYYSFSYKNDDSTDYTYKDVNIFVYLYTPIEISAFCILAISNPITLIQLYRQHKRKVALRINFQASAMLLEMSVRMGSKHITKELKDMTTRKSTRQQQRILFQISVVAVIFFSYMTVYYLYIHFVTQNSRWLSVFHSFFYSTTHMINPIIYFSFNKEMRSHLTKLLIEFKFIRLCQIFVNSNNSISSYHNSTSTKYDKKTSSFNQIDKTTCDVTNFDDTKIIHNIFDKKKFFEGESSKSTKISFYNSEKVSITSGNVSQTPEIIKITQIHHEIKDKTDNQYILRSVNANDKLENYRLKETDLSLIDTLVINLSQKQSINEGFVEDDDRNDMKRSITMFDEFYTNQSTDNINVLEIKNKSNVSISKSLTYNSFTNRKRNEDKFLNNLKCTRKEKIFFFDRKKHNNKLKNKNVETFYTETKNKNIFCGSKDMTFLPFSSSNSFNNLSQNFTNIDDETTFLETIDEYEVYL